MIFKVKPKEIEYYVLEQTQKEIQCASDTKHNTALIYRPIDKSYFVRKKGEIILTTKNVDEAVEKFNEVNFY